MSFYIIYRTYNGRKDVSVGIPKLDNVKSLPTLISIL